MGGKNPQRGAPDLLPHIPRPPTLLYSSFQRKSLLESSQTLLSGKDPFPRAFPAPLPIQEAPRRPHSHPPRSSCPLLTWLRTEVGPVRSEPARLLGSGLPAAHRPPALRREGPGGRRGLGQLLPGRGGAVRGPGDWGEARGMRTAREGARSRAGGGEAGARREGEQRRWREGRARRGAPPRARPPWRWLHPSLWL